MTSRAARLIFLAYIAAACSACSVIPQLENTNQTFYSSGGPWDSNYLTFDHPFTEAGADDARLRAERQCRQRRGKVAVKTNNACSLTRCTTSYQCMDAADAEQFSPDGTRK